MTTENLKRGTELSKMIDDLKRRKHYYSNATKIHELKLKTTSYTQSSEAYEYVETDGIIDMEIFKTLAVKNIQNQLDEAQKEFDAL